jgi:hypothetical protein
MQHDALVIGPHQDNLLPLVQRDLGNGGYIELFHRLQQQSIGTPARILRGRVVRRLVINRVYLAEADELG